MKAPERATAGTRSVGCEALGMIAVLPQAFPEHSPGGAGVAAPLHDHLIAPDEARSVRRRAGRAVEGARSAPQPIVLLVTFERSLSTLLELYDVTAKYHVPGARFSTTPFEMPGFGRLSTCARSPELVP